MEINNKKLILIVLVVCLVYAASIIATYYGRSYSESTRSNTSKSFDYRLSARLKPLVYDISLKIDLVKSKFDGSVNVSFKCYNSTNIIAFHLKELDVYNDSIRVYSHFDSSEALIFPNWLYNNETDLMIVNMFKQCRVNTTYSLFLNYTGNITTKPVGLYKTIYLDAKNESKHLIASKCEPIYARKIFPCFDEPNMKAKFRLKLIREKIYRSSFSNVRLNFTETSKNGKWDTDHYELSESMSTYLFSIVVSDLPTIIINSSKSNTTIQITYNDLDNQQIKFALSKIDQIIGFISRLFNFTYPYYITPQINIPSTNSGILSNNGVINKVYKRERNYQFNRILNLEDNRRLLTSVLAHELAHQWFGYMVAPEWWSDLWLNEGFATYVEYLMLNHSNPELNEIENLFVDLLKLMVKESIYTNISSVKTLNVNSQNEIKNQFNSIKYEKAACLIHLMASLASQEHFQQTIMAYLSKHKFSNANQDQLWSVASNKTNLNIKLIMDTWTLNKGYPVVDLNKIELNNKLLIKLSQRRFLLNSSDITDTVWKIPIQIKTATKTHALVWLKSTEDLIELNDTIDNQWLIGYYDFGYYRLNYDQKNWLLIIEQLKLDHSSLSPIDRAKLIDDSFNLARADVIDISIYLNLIEYLIKEQHSIPIETALITFDYITNMLSDDYNLLKSFRLFCINLLKHIFGSNRFQIDTNSSLTKIDLDLKVVRLLCEYGETECVKQTESYFKNWRFNNQTLPYLFESVVLDTFIQNSKDPNEWFDLLTFYEEKEKSLQFLNALAQTQNYNLLKILLNKIYSNSFDLRKSDELTLLTSTAKNRIGSYLVLDYLSDFWSNLYLKHGNNLVELVETILERFNTENDSIRQANFMANKFELNSIKGYLTCSTQLNIKWKIDNTLTISSYLSNKFI